MGFTECIWIYIYVYDSTRTVLKPRYITRISCRVNFVCRHRSSRATQIGFGTRVGSSSYTTSSMGLSGGVAMLWLCVRVRVCCRRCRFADVTFSDRLFMNVFFYGDFSSILKCFHWRLVVVRISRHRIIRSWWVTAIAIAIWGDTPECTDNNCIFVIFRSFCN